MALQHYTPDHLYCVHCHAEAAGPCATCRAMICGDCSVLTGGDLHKVVVCKPCDQKGLGGIQKSSWLSLLRVPLTILAGVALLGLLFKLFR